MILNKRDVFLRTTHACSALSLTNLEEGEYVGDMLETLQALEAEGSLRLFEVGQGFGTYQPLGDTYVRTVAGHERYKLEQDKKASLNDFKEAREYVEGIQTYFSETFGDEDDRGRQCAHLWVLLDESCKLLHGRGMG